MEKKNYLYVDELYTSYPDWSSWGKVGMDIETGDRYYFTNRHKFEIYKSLSEKTWRRVIPNDWTDVYSSYHYVSTRFPEKGTRGIDDEIVESIEKAIDEHTTYNVSRGLPIDNLVQNRKRYSVVYDCGMNAFFERVYTAAYAPETITFHIPFTSFKNISQERKTIFHRHIRHEVGHMKVSKIELNKDNDEVSVITGVCRQTLGLEKQKILHMGYLLVPTAKASLNSRDEALEEITNELELREMNPNHIFDYSDFGSRLNRITNGALQLSRYSGGVEILMQELLRIIPDVRKAQQLLEEIANNLKGDSKKGVVYVNKLMNEYERNPRK